MTATDRSLRLLRVYHDCCREDCGVMIARWLLRSVDESFIWTEQCRQKLAGWESAERYHAARIAAIDEKLAAPNT